MPDSVMQPCLAWWNEVLALRYFDAKEIVIAAGHFDELEWQYSRQSTTITLQQVAQEHAWVVLSAGLSSRVVEVIFDRISSITDGWEDLDFLADRVDMLRPRLLDAFANARKVDAILDAAVALAGMSEGELASRLVDSGLHCFERLPFMGPATSRHLAKNLGVPTAKPDRHLLRLANAIGAPSVLELCSKIADHTVEPVSVVDLTLWRFATLRRDYIDFFTAPSAASHPSTDETSYEGAVEARGRRTPS